MAVFNNILAGASGQGGAAAFSVERSLRFNSADSAYLNRTPGSAGNRKTWSLSFWIKLSKQSGTVVSIFRAGSGSGITNYAKLVINAATGQFQFDDNVNIIARSNAVFRDFSAWYHFVVTLDTTQATPSNRFKVYVNGDQLTWATDAIGTYIAQNSTPAINNSVAHAFGYETTNYWLDAYLADVHFVDGLALTADDFAETDATTGQWVPKEYSGTYGTNGFHLLFNNTADLGEDSAGSNDWTVNNILASGTKYSDDVTVNQPRSDAPATNLFDGSTSTYVQNTSGLTNPNVITVDFSGLSYSSLVEVFVQSADTSVGFNGGSLSAVTSGSFQTVTSGSGTLTQLEFSRASTSGVAIAAIRIDGAILIDPQDNDNDSLFDSPSTGTQSDTGLGGEVSGNYATLNPLDHNTGSSTFSQGNLKIVTPTNSGGVYVSTIATPTTGKWYAEATMVALSQNIYSRVGLVQVGQPRNTNQLGNAPGQIAYRVEAGDLRYNLTTLATGGAAASAGDIIGIALDQDNQTLKIYKNGVLQVTGTNIPQFNWLFAGSDDYQIYSATHEWNFGQRAFAYPVSGFKALCTSNLTDPTITDPSDYMDAVLYTGNASTQAITGLGFGPDFVWTKSRSQAYHHRLYNIVSGAGKFLESSTTNSEATDASSIISFDANGFTLGSNDNGNYTNGGSAVAWCWDAGSSTASNTDGSITSTVRANPSAGFSIVTYTGGGSAGSVGHSLNAAPSLIILKNRTFSAGTNWQVYHKDIGNTASLNLNTTSTPNTDSGWWNNTSPTSSTFSVGTYNASSDDYVAYCFAPVEGYSAFGSYTGNDVSQFIYTGFRPRFLLIKGTGTVSNQAYVSWAIIDSERDTYNVAGTDSILWANRTINEGYRGDGANAITTGNTVDLLSNGFALKNVSNLELNSSTTGTYVWAAFAESPFKYANAR